MANISTPRDNNRVPTLIGVDSSTGTIPTTVYVDPTTHRMLVDATGGGGTGTVTSVSVATANGFAGTVATQTTTPVITVSTTATGILRGNGTAVLAATPAVDYVAPGAVTSSGLTMATSKMLGRATAATGAIEEISVTGSGSAVLATSPVLVTPTLGVASATSLNKVTVTAPATGSTLTIADGKTLTASNSLTLAGTDTTTMTFPTTSATIARTDSAQTFTGVQTFTAPILGTPTSVTLTNATGLPAASIVAGVLGVTGTRMTKLWATDVESTNMPTVGGTAVLTSLTAPQFTTIELGAATDTTLSRVSAGVIAVEGVTIPTISSTSTFTNKRTNPRLVTTTSYTTNTGASLDVSTCDQFEITAQAGALLFNDPGGTPLGGQKLIIRIKDNGTARALTWNAVFRAMGTALPSTTVLSKTLYLGFIYNATDTKWDLVASAQEA